MTTDQTLVSNENKILLAARLVVEHYDLSGEKHSPYWILIFAIRDLLKLNPNATVEELYELAIAQSTIKSKGHLSRYVASTLIAQVTSAAGGRSKIGAATVFNGGRKFSFAKISAMSWLITHRGHELCETKLNLLFFYCDFTNYYLHGHSITGSMYVREYNQPLMHRFKSIFCALVDSGVLTASGQGDEELTDHKESALGSLSLLELCTVQWVFSKFGFMNAKQLSSFSQQESAYRFTRRDEFIPYEFARLLQKLPNSSIGEC